MQGKVRCTKCNNLLPIGTRFCLFCSAEQPNNQNSEPSQRRRRSGAAAIVSDEERVPVVMAGADAVIANDTGEHTHKESKEAGMEPAKHKRYEIEHSVPVPVAVPVPVGPEKPERDADGESSDTGDVAEVAEAVIQELDSEEDSSDRIAELAEQALQENAEEMEKSVKADAERQKRKSAKDEHYEKYHDALTGTQNALALQERMSTLTDNFCIISSDANSLKQVNEEKGERYGDILVISVAIALKSVFGENNCYRAEGGTYYVVLEGIGEDVVKDRMEAYKQAQAAQEVSCGVQIDVRAAAGYAFSDENQTPEDVKSRADNAMRENKKLMKQVYTPNYDGYYNDVVAEYEDMQVEFNRENIHKAVLVVIAFIIFIAIYIAYMMY